MALHRFTGALTHCRAVTLRRYIQNTSSSRGQILHSFPPSGYQDMANIACRRPGMSKHHENRAPCLFMHDNVKGGN